MNPALQTLGYGPEDRVVVIHADDVGMCHATLVAYDGLLKAGLVSSAAAMVSCAWFPQLAAYCREHPKCDMGVHLTLNCEWDGFRWGPVSTRDAASGLMDEEGYFHRSPQTTRETASAEAIRVELEAQVAQALAAGIDATHIDSHMGTVIHPDFIEMYARLGLAHGLPPFLIGAEELWEARYPNHNPGAASHLIGTALELGIPLFDNWGMMPLDQPSGRLEAAKRALDALEPGLNLLIIHPAADTPELRAIADDWESRVGDYETFSSPELIEHAHRTGVKVIGYRKLRDVLRKAV